MRILAALLTLTFAISSVGGCGLPTGVLRSRWAIVRPRWLALKLDLNRISFRTSGVARIWLKVRLLTRIKMQLSDIKRNAATARFECDAILIICEDCFDFVRFIAHIYGPAVNDDAASLI